MHILPLIMPHRRQRKMDTILQIVQNNEYPINIMT